MKTAILYLLAISAGAFFCHAGEAPRNMNSFAAHQQNQTQELKGSWGGDHISLEISDSGGALEYDCAHGAIKEKISPDANGRFSVKGTHTKESHGPVRAGSEPRDLAATYDGTVTGDSMELTVKIDETGECVGTFTLTRGAAGKIYKCR